MAWYSLPNFAADAINNLEPMDHYHLFEGYCVHAPEPQDIKYCGAYIKLRMTKRDFLVFCDYIGFNQWWKKYRRTTGWKAWITSWERID